MLPEDGYEQWPKHVGGFYIQKLVQFVDDELVYETKLSCKTNEF
jgi:hypothetical protein